MTTKKKKPVPLKAYIGEKTYTNRYGQPRKFQYPSSVRSHASDVWNYLTGRDFDANSATTNEMLKADGWRVVPCIITIQPPKARR